MSNSLQDLLQIMAQGPVTLGWGAVSVFGRARLNQLLAQQYIENFKDYRFLPSFMGTLFLNDADTDQAELENIELGPPLLSFTTASLTNSRALLTMNIVAGRYKTLRRTQGSVSNLTSTFDIAEQHGFVLEMDIDLSLVVGEVDRQGRVTLQLAHGVNMRCNLAGDDEATNQRLAGYFEEAFARLPPDRAVFELGRVNFRGYSPLTPRSFRIVTQAAPGAKIRGASNYGEGAVVVFIRLDANAQAGQFPPGRNFPYLIPDDRDAQGNDQYSATLIVASDMLPHLADGGLDVFHNLLFPGANAFVEAERHTPADLAVFGNISPTTTSLSVEPTFATIQAGTTQRFALKDSHGNTISASRWTAVGMESHGPRGQGSIDGNGLYTASARNDLGRETLRVMVKAEYARDGVTYTALALLLVVFDRMKLAPAVAVSRAVPQPQPTRLAAAVLQGEAVDWTLSQPAYGSLNVENGQAIFSPDARGRRRSLQVQSVEAQAGEAQSASILLINGEQTLGIEPAFKSGVKKSSTVELKDDQTLLPGLPRRWKVLGGLGTVDADGLFTAPPGGATDNNIVACEIVRNGIVFSTGYSVIETSELEPEPTWEELSRFTVRVPGGLDQDRLGSLFANGYQQLPLQVEVETLPVDGVYYPLSVIEMASMRLVDDNSKQQIDFVDSALEGMPEDDDQQWRVSKKRNRFRLAEPASGRVAEPAQNAPSVLQLFMHSRSDAGATTFHVTFQASDQRWWTSVGLQDINKTVTLTPRPIPVYSEADYIPFEWQRVDGGTPSDPDNASDDDWFYLHLRTVDYWKLQCRPMNQAAAIPFETLDFVPVDGDVITTSTIRWESEQMNETMFSWTGYIFSRPETAPERRVQFDQQLDHIVTSESLEVAVHESSYEAGTLVISLHRSDNVPYVRPVYPARARLSRDLAVVLLDVNGNPHKRRISFLPAGNVGDRNKLQHTLFTPSSAGPA
jgi:hypothetical protein